MHNFHHEPALIRGKADFGFLWTDYFHDSVIKNVSVSGNGKKFELLLFCDREADEDYRQGKIIRDWDFYMKSGEYDYLITFDDCKRIELDLEERGRIEYLNGRFKNIPDILTLRRKFRRNYHKFRIQLWPGSITVVFSKLEVKKLNGKKRVPSWLPNYRGIESIFIPGSEFDKENAVKEILNGDFEGQNALLSLYAIHDPDCLKYARIMFEKEVAEDDWIASTFVIGELGDSTDVSALFSKLSRLESWDKPMGKAHILDAVSKIEYRSKNLVES